MISGLSSSLSALQALGVKQGVIANNLANSSTTGFKAQRVNIHEATPTASPAIALPRAASDGTIGDGVQSISTSRIAGPGAVMQTGQVLDIAIRGSGYLTIELPNGTKAFTRDGNLHVSADGTVVTTAGHKVAGFPLVPAGTRTISISSSGVGTYEAPSGSVKFQILLARPDDPGGLENLGGNLFQDTPAAGNVTMSQPGTGGTGTISQGALELSNVDIASEMVSMIEVKHAYSASLKAIQTADQMAGEVNNIIKR